MPATPASALKPPSAHNPNIGTSNCLGVLLTTNASCNPVPLPERLYAGGATSHRGFAINGAGPRDLTTGFPWAARPRSSTRFELRLPPPTLPLVGDSVSFVIFHDMGNVFQHPGDMFKSIKNFKQPNRQTCENITTGPVPTGQDPATFYSSFTGTCNFNYYSHAVGVGARYKTPVGPIRADFSYNLNPPVYPVFFDYTAPAALRRSRQPLQLLLQHRTKFLTTCHAASNSHLAPTALSRSQRCASCVISTHYAAAQKAATTPVPTPAAPTMPTDSGIELDRVVAIVNGDLILDSDVDEERRLTALQPYRRLPGILPRQSD